MHSLHRKLELGPHGLVGSSFTHVLLAAPSGPGILFSARGLGPRMEPQALAPMHGTQGL